MLEGSILKILEFGKLDDLIVGFIHELAGVSQHGTAQISVFPHGQIPVKAGDRLGIYRVQLLRHTPRRGAVVANYEETGTMETLNALIRMNGGNMTRKQTHSFMEARIAIEGSAIRRLAEKHSDEDIAFLEGILAQADALLEKKDRSDAALAELLFRYHRGICVRSGNEFFPLLLNEFRPIIMEFWLRSIAMFGAEANVHLAKRYLDYIRAGDAEGAFRRLQRSVNEYLNCLDEQLR